MFDVAQLFTLPALLLGAGLASGVWFMLDKSGKQGAGAGLSEEAQSALALMQAELDANKESQAKVAEVHAYARQLEAKVQQLESTSESADAELRVKVLEKQLSEKADLESRLAIALQQLEDYKAKAEMFDTVVGNTPEPVVAPVFEAPVAEPVVEPVVDPVVAEKSPIEEIFAAEAAPAFEEVAEVAPVVQIPVTVSEVEEESVAAVASAESVPGITLVENEIAAKGPASPIGATAPALDERPALRIESSPSPLIELKDPLEKIEGIGQIYQTKLYEAGIRTFAQLAASSPSRITEIIEPQNWQQIDVMKWRREAALYASGEKA